MAEAAFVTWDGGGNVAVALGIATRVAARGHRVTVVGPSSLRTAILDQGLAHRELGVPAPRDPALRTAYLREVAGSTNLTAGLDRLMAAWRPDAIVIDCNLSWALQWADRGGAKAGTAVLVHTALGLYLPVWQSVLDAVNQQRRLRNEPALPSAHEAWSGTDRLLVASLRHFDREPPANMPASYIGPITAAPPTQARHFSAPCGDSRPTVVVSYSTDGLQNGPRRVQTALNALADLPVRVLASTSGLFPAARLSIPANATVVDYLPLASAVRGAALAVCHAGHGTTLTALSRGVPLVCVPGLGRDQGPIAARVAELRLGLALADQAPARDIHAAAATVLADGAYRSRAQEFAARCPDDDGADRAADELEAILDPRA